MGILKAFGGRSFGVVSRRTPNGGLTLCASRPIAKGQPLVEVPVSSCLAHSSESLVGDDASACGSSEAQHNRMGASILDRRLSALLAPRFRTARSCTTSPPFGQFAYWLQQTRGMMTGLSASTEDGHVFSLHPFEAAAALAVLEGSTLATPFYGTPQWHYLQTLPLAQFLYQGGDPSRRSDVVSILAGDASPEQVALFHDAHMCLEMIGSNLADCVLRRHHHMMQDEQLEWMAQATLLCMRSRINVLPVFNHRPKRAAEACEGYRPFIVPCIDMLRHSFDVDGEVNTKVYVDLAKGCVRAEAFKNIAAGDELYILHPSSGDAEIKGMDGSMGLVLRYGIGAFV